MRRSDRTPGGTHTPTLAPTRTPTHAPTRTLTLALTLTLTLARTAYAETVGFDEAVKEAVKKNPTAEKANEQVTRSYALMRQARASSLPTLTATGTVTRLDGDRTLAGTPPRVIAGANQLFAPITANVPLIAVGQWVKWSHADDQIDVAKASAKDVERTVAVSAARAYLTVVAQRRVVETSTRARDTAKAHGDFAKARLGAGIGNRIDEVRAAQEFATAELQLQNATLALVRAQEALGVILGREGPVDVGPEPVLVAEGDASNLTGRADIVVAGERLRAARSVQRDGWTDYMPFLNGSFQAWYQEPPGLTFPQTGWQAQLVLTLPLYDGGFRYGAQRERASLTAQARTDYDAALRQARSEVRVAAEAVRATDDALKAARDGGALAKETLDLANTAYRAGATTNLEVIDAERRARDAETQVAIAEDAARQARLDLLAASGRFPN
jgi:outer membrane protein TolC